MTRLFVFLWIKSLNTSCVIRNLQSAYSASDFMTSGVVEGREAFVNRLGEKMEIVVQGMDTNTVK